MPGTAQLSDIPTFWYFHSKSIVAAMLNTMVFFIGSSRGSDLRRISDSEVIPVNNLESPESGVECMKQSFYF